MLRPVPNPSRKPVTRRPDITVRDVVAAAAMLAVLAVGARWLDAEQASDAGAAGSIVDLMLGGRVQHVSPWDFTGPGGPVTCYGDSTGFGTPAEQCDTDPDRPGIQLPGPAPLTRLRPGAACPPAVPVWATCADPAPSPSPAPSGWTVSDRSQP